MNVFDPIFAELNEITPVSGRIFRATALKNASPPFIFFEDLTEDEAQALDGYTGLLTSGFNIHVVAARSDQLDPIAAAVKSALIAMQGTSSGGYLYSRINIRRTSPEIHEKEVNLSRKVFNLVIDYQEVTLNEQI